MLFISYANVFAESLDFSGKTAISINFRESTVIDGKYFVNKKLALIGGSSISLRNRDDQNTLSGTHSESKSTNKSIWLIGGLRYYFKNIKKLRLFYDSEIGLNYLNSSYRSTSFDPEGNPNFENTQNEKLGSVSFFESFGGEYYIYNNLSLDSRLGFTVSYTRQLEGDKVRSWGINTFRSHIGASFYF